MALWSGLIVLGMTSGARAEASRDVAPTASMDAHGNFPIWPQASGLDLKPATIDDNGTLHVPAFSLPTSDLISPEFRDAYLRTVISEFPRYPKLDAPLKEWDEFHAEEDRRAEPRLAALRARNPVNVTETRIGGVDVAVVTPMGGVSPENRNRVLLYFHGGGFFLNRNLKAAMGGAIPIASVGKIKVIALSYRQFPAFRYPAASEDVASVFTALLKEHEPESIGFFGCSGGGVLTGQAVAWLQLHALPRPGAVALLCAAPMVPGRGPYLWAAGDSRFWGARGNLLGDWPGADAANGYFQGVKLDDPGAYPGTSEKVLSQFPPTLNVAGTRAVEMSQVVAAHARFLRLGVKSSLYIIEGGWHGSPIGAQGTPEGDASIAYIARWFQENLAR